MKVMTRAKAKTESGSAKGSRSAIREWIDGSGSTLVNDTQKQAREALHEAQKMARRQVTRARIAGARARAQSRAKASGLSKKAVGVAGAAGLVAGYFLDPESGRRRRHVARERALALVRRGAERTRPEKPAPNDQALADRVKSEIFQPADAPKDSVNINVENGVVYLRGEVKQPDQIRKLVKEAGAVDGVRGVENLLHTA